MSSIHVIAYPRFRPHANRPLRAALSAVALVAALSGCATGPSLLESAETEADIATATTTLPPSGPGAASDAAFVPYYRQAAAVAMAEGQIYGAVAHLAKVHEAEPEDPKVAYDLARHLRYIGALGEAETVLGAALARHADDTDLLLERGKLLIAQGRAGEAEAILMRLTKAAPSNAEVLLALGVARDRRGDHKSAQAAYQTAIELGEPSAELLNNAALSRLIEGDAGDAVGLLRRAAASPGATAQVRQNLALALVITGERAEAKRIIEENLPAELALDTLALYERLADGGTGPVDAWSLASGGQPATR